MESINTVLELIQRNLDLGDLMRQPGGLRTSEEAELQAIQARLDACPADVAAIMDVAATLQRPLRALTVNELRIARAQVSRA